MSASESAAGITTSAVNVATNDVDGNNDASLPVPPVALQFIAPTPVPTKGICVVARLANWWHPVGKAAARLGCGGRLPRHHVKDGG